MDVTKALQKLLDQTASEEDVQLLKQALVSGEISVGGNINQAVIIIGSDNKVEITPEELDRLNKYPSSDQSANEGILFEYLQYIISKNRLLQLQGILLDTESVNPEIERVYIRPRVSYKSYMEDQSHKSEKISEISEVLNVNHHLIILGKPGFGKTTFLRYLALLYARDMLDKSRSIQEKIGIEDRKRLPMLFELRQLEKYLILNSKNDGTEGPVTLIDFLTSTAKNYVVGFPDNFFNAYLESGQAILLFDGLDEMTAARRGAIDMIKSLRRKYPDCRFIVTSRIEAHKGDTRLDDNLEFEAATLQEFTLENVEHFLTTWKPQPDSLMSSLIEAIENNARLQNLSLTPLLLTIIALTFHGKLYDRRVQLYSRLMYTLLEKLDKNKEINTFGIESYPLKAEDCRIILQELALKMFEKSGQQTEISKPDLVMFLGDKINMVQSQQERKAAIEVFHKAMVERAGILSVGEGTFSFSHLSIQEYLAACALANLSNYIKYTLQKISNPVWREIIVLEAGCLSVERSLQLIKAIADYRNEQTPYLNLILASECLFEVGFDRPEIKKLIAEINSRLLRALTPPNPLSEIINRRNMKTLLEQRSKIVQILIRPELNNKYWHGQYGEPNWISIPTEENQTSKYFQISPVPITNAQYLIFIQDTKHDPPWGENGLPKGKESHPVVHVSQLDAVKYCNWLSKKINQIVTLPSKAEWERAAQGKHKQEYPWGKWKDYYANTNALGRGDTMPVGIFLEGMSPYGILDMSGNVWEWTRDSINEGNPTTILMCGGSFTSSPEEARIANCTASESSIALMDGGFRVVIS